MASIVSALYNTAQAVDDVIEDLVATGIPRDQIATDPDHRRVSVTLSTAAEPEVTGILKRHQPSEVHAKSTD